MWKNIPALGLFGLITLRSNLYSSVICRPILEKRPSLETRIRGVETWRLLRKSLIHYRLPKKPPPDVKVGDAA